MLFPVGSELVTTKTRPMSANSIRPKVESSTRSRRDIAFFFLSVKPTRFPSDQLAVKRAPCVPVYIYTGTEWRNKKRQKRKEKWNKYRNVKNRSTRRDEAYIYTRDRRTCAAAAVARLRPGRRGRGGIAPMDTVVEWAVPGGDGGWQPVRFFLFPNENPFGDRPVVFETFFFAFSKTSVATENWR